MPQRRGVAASKLPTTPPALGGFDHLNLIAIGTPDAIWEFAVRFSERQPGSASTNLSIEEVKRCIAAYHRLCPELDRHLQDEVDAGVVLAGALQMTPDEYNQAIGRNGTSANPEQLPQGWLGGMLLKTLAAATPITRNGRPFTPDELGYFWAKAQQLVGQIDAETDRILQSHEPSKALRDAVRNWAGRRSVITSTGRLRANASFCSARNNLFQGVAADGAISALWFLWRAGYRIVAFVHDQVVIESPADDRVLERKAHIENLLIEGMHTVIPDTLVKVETVVTQSLDKSDVDHRYSSQPSSQPPVPIRNADCSAPCDAVPVGAIESPGSV